MGYASLADCVRDLETNGELRVIDLPVDPNLELAHIQRRAFKRGSPALLFTRPKGCRFPMLANLFGTQKRLEFIFRDSLEAVESLFRAKANPKKFLSNPLNSLKMLGATRHAPLALVKPEKAAVLACRCDLGELPRLISWPGDGGPFITLPLAHSQSPLNGSNNLGMYRIQLSGNSYAADEIGLHYQLQRGIGVHHAQALEKSIELPVHVYVGGPPSLSVAAVMPLPEGLDELLFAGLLGGRRIRVCQARQFSLPVVCDCDFLIQGRIISGLKPEGPFGDHIGYYSLKHDFPVLKVESVWRRKDAIWPFTSVGRPPQEDTVFGDFIHRLTSPLVKQVFPGVREVHAVDVAGVHPLLLAVGSERYTAYEARRKPRELLTQAMHLLGNTQTALAKFLLIACHEDAPGLSARDVGAFFRHMLERTDFANDLHFLTRATCDTLDYSGTALNEGSKLIWACAGEKRRELGTELNCLLSLPPGFSSPRIVAPGMLAVQGPRHAERRGMPDDRLARELCASLAVWEKRECFPLLAVVDDSAFCAASMDNFLWTVFTRADPATDSYGINAGINAKHWSCAAPLILDARQKSFHAPVLEDNPEIVARVNGLAAHGGPLAGLV